VTFLRVLSRAAMPRYLCSNALSQYLCCAMTTIANRTPVAPATPKQHATRTCDHLVVAPSIIRGQHTCYWQWTNSSSFVDRKQGLCGVRGYLVVRLQLSLAHRIDPVDIGTSLVRFVVSWLITFMPTRYTTAVPVASDYMATGCNWHHHNP